MQHTILAVQNVLFFFSCYDYDANHRQVDISTMVVADYESEKHEKRFFNLLRIAWNVGGVKILQSENKKAGSVM